MSGPREVKLTPLGVGGATPGTAVKLPIARTFEFADTEEFTQLRGDDGVADRSVQPVRWVGIAPARAGTCV